MPLNNFSAVFLPYCLKRQPDGRYAVLNREYKPVGFFTKDTLDYDKFPVLVKLPGLRPAVAARLSYKGDPDTQTIFLYGTNRGLVQSKTEMRNYLARLERLGCLKVAGDPARAER